MKEAKTTRMTKAKNYENRYISIRIFDSSTAPKYPINCRRNSTQARDTNRYTA